MNIQNLGTGKYAAFDNVRARIGAAYEQIASGSDYRKNTAHRSWPNNSEATNARGIAAQLNLAKGPCARGERR
jgi:hypothetical protein